MTDVKVPKTIELSEREARSHFEEMIGMATVARADYIEAQSVENRRLARIAAGVSLPPIEG